uniref:Uncharacterized protein n=1 Tax=Arundo donax TaxID=35708 RepID=A0A0A9EXR3_ARUDO
MMSPSCCSMIFENTGTDGPLLWVSFWYFDDVKYNEISSTIWSLELCSAFHIAQTNRDFGILGKCAMSRISSCVCVQVTRMLSQLRIVFSILNKVNSATA